MTKTENEPTGTSTFWASKTRRGEGWIRNNCAYQRRYPRQGMDPFSKVDVIDDRDIETAGVLAVFAFIGHGVIKYWRPSADTKQCAEYVAPPNS